MARRLTAEAGMMMPTSDSDGTFLPKVSGVQQLRMSDVSRSFLGMQLGAPPVHAWSRVSRDRCDSWVLWVHGRPGITSQNRRVGPRDGERVPEHPVPYSCKVKVLSAS